MGYVQDFGWKSLDDYVLNRQLAADFKGMARTKSTGAMGMYETSYASAFPHHSPEQRHAARIESQDQHRYATQMLCDTGRGPVFGQQSSTHEYLRAPPSKLLSVFRP